MLLKKAATGASRKWDLGWAPSGDAEFPAAGPAQQRSCDRDRGVWFLTGSVTVATKSLSHVSSHWVWLSITLSKIHSQTPNIVTVMVSESELRYIPISLSTTTITTPVLLQKKSPTVSEEGVWPAQWRNPNPICSAAALLSPECPARLTLTLAPSPKPHFPIHPSTSPPISSLTPQAQPGLWQRAVSRCGINTSPAVVLYSAEGGIPLISLGLFACWRKTRHGCCASYARSLLLTLYHVRSTVPFTLSPHPVPRTVPA